MARYFKRRWEDSRGDYYDHWGTATYLFEVAEDGDVLRQVEIYDAGQKLRYDRDENPGDLYGFFSEEPLDFEAFSPFEIESKEFDLVWAEGSWTNDER
jgi:hypothetical protein